MPRLYLCSCASYAPGGVGEANHLDPYAQAKGAIHRLVNFSVAGVCDPAPFVKSTGVQQQVPKTLTGDQIGWVPPYV